MIPDANRLREILCYDPETGSLTWRSRKRESFATLKSCNTWNSRYAGTPALRSLDSHGYMQGHCDGRLLLAHRVAWAIYHGAWPDRIVDHINHDKLDNRIQNLRLVTNSESARNKPLSPRNKSGVAGVQRVGNRWVVTISTTQLGSFRSFDDAVAARRAAEVEMGFHPNHGRPRVAS